MNSDAHSLTSRMLLEAFDHKPVAFVDIETTGVSPLNNRMIEIGIIRINPDASLKSYTTLVNPDQPLSYFIKNMTGIEQSEVDEAPRFEEVSSDIKSMLENAVFIAHNARFDYSFIQSEFGRFGHLFSAKTLCTVQLSRKLYPAMKRHSLAHIIETFQIPVLCRHRALDDAKVMYEWLRISGETLGIQTVQDTILLLMKERVKKTAVPEEQLSSVPAVCGTYLFRDTENRAVYVGRGLNLKQRVWSHLHNSSLRPKEKKIAELSAEVEYFRTPGELSAFIKAEELIRAEDPILNKKILRHQKSVACTEYKTSKGYKSIRIKPMLKTDPLKETVVGTFKSKKHAVRALNILGREYCLCEKWCGSGTGNQCPESHSEFCSGACRNEENPESYNLRFDKAFKNIRFPEWTFLKPVLITEHGNSDSVGTAFLVDKWCIQAVIHFEEECQNVSIQDENFRWDAYLIIRKYLNGRKKNLTIRQLTEDQIRRLLSS